MIDYESAAPIASALVERYKDYRKALAEGDGYAQCRNLGSMNMHRLRLCSTFGYNDVMIQMLLEQAQREIEENKKG